MSEKRFRITTLPKSNAVAFDEKQKKHYIGIDFENLLNEQQSTIQSLKEENDGIKTKGLDVLAFYESKLKNVVGTEDFQSVRDEIWIVRQVLYEMGVINDE